MSDQQTITPLDERAQFSDGARQGHILYCQAHQGKMLRPPRGVRPADDRPLRYDPSEHVECWVYRRLVYRFVPTPPKERGTAHFTCDAACIVLH